MNVSAMYIPRSKRGREVYRLLKPTFSYLRYEDVLGHYVCNLEVDTLSHKTLCRIAYILDPAQATVAESDAMAMANDIRDRPAAHGIDPDDDARIEVEATLAEKWAE